MNAWNRYVHGSVAAVRPWLLQKGLLLLLAFDTWLLMVAHGGRYGIGDFNVAHFRWLGAIQPMPTPPLYVGLLLVCGMLAFALVFVRPPRVALAALTLLYTWGWAMSMLDSYQHHYLLSLLLLSVTFFPARSAAELWEGPAAQDGQASHARSHRRAKGHGKTSRRKSRRARRQARNAGVKEAARGAGGLLVPAWAWATFGTTCAIVYGYTAITKLQPDWRQGHALRRLTGRDPTMKALMDWMGQLGVGRDAFWELAAAGAIVTQLVLAVGYAVAVRRDELRSRGARLLCWIALASALAFHIGVEMIGLSIGWFSYYMLFVAFVFMLPAGPLWVVARGVSWPARRLARAWQEASDREDDLVSLGVLGVATGGTIAAVGYLVDLPGSLGAGVVVGLSAAVATVGGALRGRPRRGRAWAVACTAAALVMWASIGTSTVRFDYYRLVGGDARRRGELRKALHAYHKANVYAPADDDREDEERALRRKLGLEPGDRDPGPGEVD